MVLTALGAMTFAGCTAPAEGKSGAVPAQTTLVLASNDNGGLDGAPAVQRFVERVEELSGGSVKVRVATRWKGGADEVKVLEDVAAGEADLGWAGTRSLDQIGIHDLTPLHAPFLVDSYSAQRAVVLDSRITSRLTNLERVGLQGLAILADELRMPVGVNEPLLTPEDYRRALIRTSRSDIQAEGLRALGATPTTDAFGPTMDGAELSWRYYVTNDFTSFAHFPTVNMPLWPRTVVLVANPTSMSRLDAQHHEWVVEAASDAATWSVVHARDRENEDIAKACAAGAKLARATDAEVADLQATVLPVYQRLRDDERTRQVMAHVEALVAGAAADPPPHVAPACIFEPGDLSLAQTVEVPLTAPGQTGDLPDGVYRYELTEDALSAAGLPPADVTENAGVWTWTLRGGRWSFQQVAVDERVLNTRCSGFYDVDGARVMLSATQVTASGECAPTRWEATWSLEGGALVWSDVSIPDLSPVFAGEPWRRVG